VEQEISRALEFSLYVLRSMGLTDFKAYLSTRPEKYVGDPADWNMATEALRHAIEAHNLPYEMDEGGGAFYGPKIDLKVMDALDREWQLSTIQFDFNLPERFGLEYIGEDGQPRRPYMVHRALLGSMERFFGVLIEHFGGAFPVWMAPVQVVVIPIADRHLDYAREIAEQLRADGLRVELDERSERMNAKIRDAQKQKVPYMLVIGDNEWNNQHVSLRVRDGSQQNNIPLGEFVARAKDKVSRRTSEL
jgi:threonyl-tRNA synthetase